VNIIISNGNWPARSPDLKPCDFFFWGCLKDKAYKRNSQTEEMKENVPREIANIPAEPLPPVRGMSTCTGQRFQHLI
jgi:hypothetical protein